MTFESISESLVSLAKDEGLDVSDCNGVPVIKKDSLTFGIVVCGDYDLSFHCKKLGSPGLLIDRFTNLDEALSRGLDYIYSAS